MCGEEEGLRLPIEAQPPYLLAAFHEIIGTCHNLCMQICFTEDILVHQNIFLLNKLQGTVSERKKFLIVL